MEFDYNAPYETRLQSDYLVLLKEASNYYMARGDVFTTPQNLTRRLDDAKIPYALVEGLALAAHGFVRMTQDVDLLVTREGLETFKQTFLGRGYVLAFSGAQKTFRDTETRVRSVRETFRQLWHSAQADSQM